MPTNLYSQIGGGDDTIEYLTTPVLSEQYPDASTVNIMGPLWLPKVYGKNLSAFEIASSGKVAITVRDIHTMDINSDKFNGVDGTLLTTLMTKSNYAIEMMANNRDVRLLMDTYQNNVVVHAASNIILDTSSNNLEVSVAKDTNIITRSNVLITADYGDLQLYANNSNMYIRMLKSESNLSSYSSKDMTTFVNSNYIVTVCNLTSWTSESNVSLASISGNMYMSAAFQNMYINMMRNTSNMSLYSSSNMQSVALRKMSLSVPDAVGSDNGIYVDAGGVASWSLDGAGTFKLSTTSNISMAATTQADLQTSKFINLSTSNLLITASNVDCETVDTVVTASRDIMMRASQDTQIVGESKLGLLSASSNVNIILNSTGTILSAYALSNIHLTADVSAIRMSANKSNVWMDMNGPGSLSNLDVYAVKDVNITASNTMTQTTKSNWLVNAVSGTMSMYSDQNFFVNADQSNMFLRMTVPSDYVSLYGSGGVSVSTSNDLSLMASDSVDIFGSNIGAIGSNISLYAARDFYITASNDMNTNVTGNYSVNATGEMSYYARSNMSFFIAGAPVFPNYPTFEVVGTEVKVRGDLTIIGSINTSNITTTNVFQDNLKVSDKVITLATVGSNVEDGLPVDGLATNDKSGIVIDGSPEVFTYSNMYEVHNKSFLWNYGANGTTVLGTSNITSESFWELQGGSLRLTCKRNVAPANQPPTIRDVSFGFRINEMDELELVKKFWNGGNYVFKRVAKFGRSL